MVLNRLIRWSGLAAIVGGVLIANLTLLETYSFHGRPSEPWMLLVSPVVEPIIGLALRFVPPGDVLYLFGRPQGIALLLLLLGVVGLHRLLAGRAGHLARWGYYLALLALTLALVGNVGDMWLGKDAWGTEREWIPAFGGACLALGALLLSIASLLIGIALLRSHLLPRWSAWILVFAAICSVPVAILVIQGLSAMYFLVSLGWSVLGYVLWAGANDTGESMEATTHT